MVQVAPAGAAILSAIAIARRAKFPRLLNQLRSRELPAERARSSPSSHPAVQPDAVQKMRPGGSSPRLTAASTGLRPCVLKASRVSSATGPLSSLSMAARETSTRVQTSRPSEAVDLIDQEAPTLLLSGASRADSRTRHSSATALP